jgi:hypothetical protein
MFFSLCLRLKRGLALAGLACAAAATAWADEFVTIDFPIRKKDIAAEGLSAPPRQVAAPNGDGYAEVLLRPVRKGDRIFLTFVFEEDGGKGPSVFWSGDTSGKQVTLTDNLAEGVAGLNRRTFALPEEVAREAGHLYIMGRQDRLLRLRIDWLQASQTFVATDQERPQLILGGTPQLDRDLTGQAKMTPPDAWFGPVLDAALQDGVADLSENIELVVPLKAAPGPTRLRAKFLGLPLGRSVRVWVNGRVVGRIQPAVPSLTDPGYVRRGKRVTYAGWREGALTLDADALQQGENTILFESPGKGAYLSGAALEIVSPDMDVDAPALETPEAAPAPSASPDAASSPTPTPGPTPVVIVPAVPAP